MKATKSRIITLIDIFQLSFPFIFYENIENLKKY